MKFYVSNLHRTTSSEDLRQLFEDFGKVKKIRIKPDPDENKVSFYAKINMPDDDEAHTAIDELDGERVDGNFIKVSENKSLILPKKNKNWEEFDENDEDKHHAARKKNLEQEDDVGDW